MAGLEIRLLDYLSPEDQNKNPVRPNFFFGGRVGGGGEVTFLKKSKMRPFK